MIEGIDVVLYDTVEVERDPFNNPITEESAVTVKNVLVVPLSENEIKETYDLTGKRAVYQLAIPKGDSHDWKDKKVEFFGQTFHTIGMPLEGIERMIPLSWNKKVRVEVYE